MEVDTSCLWTPLDFSTAVLFISLYFSSQPFAPGSEKPRMVARGERRYIETLVFQELFHASFQDLQATYEVK